MKSIVSRKTLKSAKYLGLLVVIGLLAACGADWFPEYKRPATQPDPFTFTKQTDVEPGQPVTSNAITVAGITADSSPITISATGTSTSLYSINGGTPTSTAGTVKNGDKVTVTHTPVDSPGSIATSTVTIGGLQGAFVTVNQLVATPSFTLVNTGTGLQAYALLVAADGPAITHTVSITSSGGAATYWITDASGSTFLVSSTNTTITRASLNDDRLYVQVPSSSVTATLTIDNVPFLLQFSTSGVTVTRQQPSTS
jgi:hypothetical protein